MMKDTPEVRSARLLEALANIDPEEEKALSEEGLAGDVKRWPVYDVTVPQAKTGKR